MMYRSSALCFAMPFRSEPKGDTNEGTSSSIEDPDTALTMIVLLLACLAFAVLPLAHSRIVLIRDSSETRATGAKALGLSRV